MQGMNAKVGYWGQRRNLFVWEVKLVEECKILLPNISLQDNMKDAWIWDRNSDGMYSTKEAYDLISNFEDITDSHLI